MDLKERIAQIIWAEMHAQAKHFAYGKMTVDQAKDIVDQISAKVFEMLCDTNQLENK